MDNRVIFCKIRPCSKIKVMAEPELIEFLEKEQGYVVQIVDLFGSRPINVLRYLVEYEEKLPIKNLPL